MTLKDETWKADRIGAALANQNPTVLQRMSAGFAVIGDIQFLPGYSVLLVDRPGIERLSDLPKADRLKFLDDMDILGEAVERVCAANDSEFLRVNIEILGNTDPFLHAHVWPRFAWEAPELVRKPVWLYPPTHWSSDEFSLNSEHDELREKLRKELAALTQSQ